MRLLAIVVCLIAFGCSGDDSSSHGDAGPSAPTPNGDGDGDSNADGGDAQPDAGDGGGGDAQSDAGDGEAACGWSFRSSEATGGANDVLLLDDGGVVVVGWGDATTGTFFNATGGFAMRFDADGQVMWTTSYPDTLVVTVSPGLSDAVVVIAGEATTDASCSNFHGGTSDGWIAEINLDDGGIVKSDCIGGSAADSIRAVEAAAVLGDGYRVYGWTTSQMTGDIGTSRDDANHHGDIMLGTWSTAGGASVWCYGSIGSDSALFLLDDNLVAAATNGGASGDFEAFPYSDPNSSLFLSLSPSEPCVDATCVAPTWVLNPGPATVLVAGSDSWLAANAQQIEGALGCPNDLFQPSALIARYDSGTLVDTVCLGAPGTTTLASGIGSSSDAIAIVGSTSRYDIAPFVGATIDGTVEPVAGTAAFIALYGKVPSIASEPSEIVLVKAASAVSLGAVAIRDDGCVIAAGSTTEGRQSDVFVYSRSITP